MQRRATGTLVTSAGFTLVDTLLVLLILGIVAMGIAPVAQSYLEDSRLRAAGGELVAALQYAGVLAVRYERPFQVETLVSKHRFMVQDVRFAKDPDPHHDQEPPVHSYGVVLNPVDKKWYDISFGRDTQYSGVSLEAATVATLVFYPDGNASQEAKYAIAYGKKRLTIHVEAATGRILTL